MLQMRADAMGWAGVVECEDDAMRRRATKCGAACAHGACGRSTRDPG
ncbi:hypothetical protein K788_0008117 [Paraburkholderia caribensis MBA4]|uniref:Uncharacterized protein n=1 Tax=Paraburkholderia caribensis MBA4 TaxID=1323664 RepID=A0A0P0RFX8_9BURK|nr:hypothetical protein K788_0008117 [Paraburkholderia caribensis MBA4]